MAVMVVWNSRKLNPNFIFWVSKSTGCVLYFDLYLVFNELGGFHFLYVISTFNFHSENLCLFLRLFLFCFQLLCSKTLGSLFWKWVLYYQAGFVCFFVPCFILKKLEWSSLLRRITLIYGRIKHHVLCADFASSVDLHVAPPSTSVIDLHCLKYLKYPANVVFSSHIDFELIIGFLLASEL